MNTSSLEEYERLRQNSIFDTIEKVTISEDTTTLVLVNIRSLLKHALDIAIDNRLINNDILCFTETQIQPHYFASTIESLFKNFVIYFNNNSNKFLSLAYGCTITYNLLIERIFLVYQFLILSKVHILK